MVKPRLAAGQAFAERLFRLLSLTEARLAAPGAGDLRQDQAELPLGQALRCVYAHAILRRVALQASALAPTG